MILDSSAGRRVWAINLACLPRGGLLFRQMDKPTRASGEKRESRRLTARQETAIRELLVQQTIRKAAQAAHVSEATLRRWLDGHAEFQRRYREARRELLEGSAR